MPPKNLTRKRSNTYVTNQIDEVEVTTAPTTAVTQSGTWTFQPGNTANTTPWLATINQGGNSASVSASNALKVDGSAVTQPVSQANPVRASTATLSNVAGDSNSTTIISSNANRKGAIIYNDSTADLYLKFGATASTSSFSYLIRAADHWEMPHPIYTGVVDGIWTSATGNARVTELT